MNAPGKPVTVLWALRSPCDFACPHCYFGVLEHDRLAPPEQLGRLTHLPHGDAPLPVLLDFLTDIADSAVGRVVLAGGEPLIWPGLGTVLTALADARVQTVLCTNGVALNRPRVRQMLADTGVAAVSVSLDSLDPAINDRQRPARGRADSHARVVEGISALLADRAAGRPAVGVYTVITRATLPRLVDTARFVAALGVDYFVAQPVALEPGHPLERELSLRASDIPALEEAFAEIAAADLGMALPAAPYPGAVVSTVRHRLQRRTGCYGGHRLAFIQPDGTVFDCPSSYKIASQVAAGTHRSIRGHRAGALFPPPAVPGGDCALLSVDCVNMDPLMDFDRVLKGAS